MRPKALLLFIAIALLGGCKSEPAKICHKIDELAAKAMIDGDVASKEIASKLQASSSTCVTQYQEIEKEDHESFAIAAPCIEVASDIDGLVRCFYKAAGAGEPPTSQQSVPVPPPARP